MDERAVVSALVFDAADYLVPVARFAGGAWIIAAGFLLPASRPRRTNDAGTAPARR